MGVRRWWRRRSARRGAKADHLRTLGRVAGEIADGDTAGLVVLDVARTLVELLDLGDCEFQVAPFADFPDGRERPTMRRDGRMELRGQAWDPVLVGLPTGGFLMPVVARGRTEGRYLCTPNGPGRPSAERLVVAQVLADQTASALLLDSVA